MLIKNTGDKIVNVGRDILMPGEEKEYQDGLFGHNALATMIGMGFIEVSMKKKAEKQEEEKPASTSSPFLAVSEAEEAAGEAAPEEEKKQTRRSAKK